MGKVTTIVTTEYTYDSLNRIVKEVKKTEETWVDEPKVGVTVGGGTDWSKVTCETDSATKIYRANGVMPEIRFENTGSVNINGGEIHTTGRKAGSLNPELSDLVQETHPNTPEDDSDRKVMLGEGGFISTDSVTNETLGKAGTISSTTISADEIKSNPVPKPTIMAGKVNVEELKPTLRKLISESTQTNSRGRGTTI